MDLVHTTSHASPILLCCCLWSLDTVRALCGTITEGEHSVLIPHMKKAVNHRTLYQSEASNQVCDCLYNLLLPLIVSGRARVQHERIQHSGTGDVKHHSGQVLLQCVFLAAITGDARFKKYLASSSTSPSV
jgi:hypothetical protein